MTRIITIVLFLCGLQLPAQAQYAPQATVAGSDAIHKSSSVFMGWATGCALQRGYMDIAQPGMGYASLGDSIDALGDIDNAVVSLGDSGVAVLTFSSAIYNGPGADFAVFENGFPNPNNAEESFMELAFVEVSSDGVGFTRFPAASLTGVSPQVPAAGVYMNARQVNNLAGKYISNYGTPFDLQELAGTPGLDVNNITHIRIVDVIGDVAVHTSTDKDGNIINDPYPSAFPSSGLDLDGVGAIYLHGATRVAGVQRSKAQLYPNPVTEALYISNAKGSATLTDLTGKLLWQGALQDGVNTIQLTNYPAGTYLLQIVDTSGTKCIEKIVKL